jgi:hypothetical protein
VALLAVLAACTGGKDFTAAGPSDASVVDASDANDAADASAGNIILNPNDNGSVDASADDGQNCAASEVQCDGGCKAEDTNNCGGCGVECPAPDAGAATCGLSGGHYACGVACNTGYSRCGNSCVDLQSDVNNCGQCGHGCLGAMCHSGLCQSWVVADEQTQNALLFPARAGLFAHAELVTDGKNIVWIDGQAGVLETSSVGGPSSPIINIAPMSATSALGFGNLALANGTAIWTMWDSNNGISVWKATAVGKSTDANTGTMVASLGATTAGDIPSGIAIDATAANVYFIDSVTMMSGTAVSNPGLFTCVVANKSCTKLVAASAPTKLAFANDVAIADGRIFYTDSARTSVNQYLGNYQMTAAPVVRLALDGTYVYWLDEFPADASAGISNQFDVFRAPMSNIIAAPELVVPAQLGLPYAMTTDGTNVYFSNAGTLEYMPVSGTGAPQTLTNSQQVYAIAVGGGAIYWLDGDGTIDGIAAP